MRPKMINIGSWNVRGMGDPVKKAAIFTTLEGYGVEVICIQETHLTKETKLKLVNKKNIKASTTLSTLSILEE